MPDNNKRILGLSIEDAVTGTNLFSFYMACLVAILLATFLPQTQVLILSEYLDVPFGELEIISGNLNFWGEIVIILTIGLFGVASDRVGRRIVMSGGFLIMSVAFWLYPRAESVNELLLFRLIYSAGIAAVSVMLVTVVADYVKDVSRGKATGYLGVMNGLGAMIAALVLIKLPARFVEGGASPLDAGVMTFNIVIAISLGSAVLMWFGLKKGLPAQHEERPGFFTMLTDGVRAARDPGIALAYGASFVARGNLAVAGTFLSIWLVKYGTIELGMEDAEALAKAGTIIAISYSAALFGAPILAS